MKKLNWRRGLTIFVFLSLILALVFTSIQLYQASTGAVSPGDKTAADYRLMIFQCLLGIIVMFLPSLLSKQLKITIPGNMYLIFVIFLYCSIYLGEVRSFYYLIPHWDTILHTFSGAMLGALGFSLVSILNNDEHSHMKLSPLFVAIFACCFAVTLGVLWEIYEFAADSLLGLNMQKTLLENGTPLMGKAAVADTMEDLIVDFLGAFVMALIGYFSMKHGKSWLKKISLKRHEQKTSND
ncbi:hypothetical protein [Culicoidibacter larvae]|uniref:DUF2238 domain-containing protein n=1 Tax=Culicoidibacter larvae TaxID=2579976 RepID=A0A5R8QH47_9FIRM|nr:hypothetical protein [Culicoidibacter larvae]TLG77302.1 hypothetical protein FEZ08_01410 [Culicoidibacter larvae]